jgi:hypothetical protein
MMKQQLLMRIADVEVHAALENRRLEDLLQARIIDKSEDIRCLKDLIIQVNNNLQIEKSFATRADLEELSHRLERQIIQLREMILRNQIGPIEKLETSGFKMVKRGVNRHENEAESVQDANG